MKAANDLREAPRRVLALNEPGLMAPVYAILGSDGVVRCGRVTVRKTAARDANCYPAGWLSELLEALLEDGIDGVRSLVVRGADGRTMLTQMRIGDGR